MTLGTDEIARRLDVGQEVLSEEILGFGAQYAADTYTDAIVTRVADQLPGVDTEALRTVVSKIVGVVVEVKGLGGGYQEQLHLNNLWRWLAHTADVAPQPEAQA